MRIPSKVSTRTDELSGGGHRIRLHSRQGGQVPWIGRISPHSAAGSSFPSPWCDSCSTPGNLEPHPVRRSRPIEKDYAFEIPTAQERMRRTTCLRADVVIRQGKGPRQALTGCKCTRTFCARDKLGDRDAPGMRTRSLHVVAAVRHLRVQKMYHLVTFALFSCVSFIIAYWRPAGF